MIKLVVVVAVYSGYGGSVLPEKIIEQEYVSMSHCLDVKRHVDEVVPLSINMPIRSFCIDLAAKGG